MVKIISRKSLGTQTVYDIGVERDHNFILANGSVASNCFNKSHSTAYAYVTYQTAYLKANFPAEYMAALLTHNSDDQDKVKKYIANSQELGITVEGPDINRSDVTFTPSNGKILFGLSAVKNVGANAIANILAAREEGGEFKDLADLCDRVNLHTVNSRALESLIKCGALDKLNPNRQQLMAHLPLVVSWAQKSKDTSEQPTLFDLGSVRSPAPRAPQVNDFPVKEKLQYEKELLGFYVSDHPLKYAERFAKQQGIELIYLNQVEDWRSRKPISAIVMLTEVKQLLTKKSGERMAILLLEDLTGKGEAVVFPKTYEVVQSSLVTDTPVILRCKIEKPEDRDRNQIIVEEVTPIEAEHLAVSEQILPIENDPEPVVMLELTLQQISDEQKLKHLKMIFQEYSSDAEAEKIPVIAILAGEHSRQVIRFGEKYRLQDPEGVVSRLNNDGFSASTKQLKINF